MTPNNSIQPQLTSVENTATPSRQASASTANSSPITLPTVEELLKTPIRPSDTFQLIPRPCLHAAMLLLIRSIRAAAAITSPIAAHQALLHLHMIPTVVLRKSFRGENCWRSNLGQMHVLRRRITRASRGEWGALWQEAITAHKSRDDWYRLQHPQRGTSASQSRRTTRAMRLASQAQYTRAMRALVNAPLADLNDSTTHSVLRTLHPSPPNPTTPISESSMPPAPEITEAAVLRAVKRMNPNSAAGPDRMPPRLLHLLVTSEVSPEAGVTGLSALTSLIGRLARGSIPDQSLPLLAAATLLPIRPRPGKIRPIAIGQALRRLVTKVLLPPAIASTRGYLATEQLANGIPSAMDAIVHDARMLMKRHGNEPNFVMVPIDAKNAFNACSRQNMLDVLPDRAPTLARFVNAMYAKTTPLLIVPSRSPVVLHSRQGTQQGDPASMLLFSFTIQPLIRRISQESSLALNRWYADDGLLIGTIDEVKKALQILRDEGPFHHFYLHIGKTKAYWPSIDSHRLAALTNEIPIDVVTSGGVEMLGAPLGSRDYMERLLQEKLESCNKALSKIEDIPDARIKFHLHRMCGSACRVQHLFRLTPPEVSIPFAARFDQDQLNAYSRFNSVKLTPAATEQLRLPFRKGGHGFTPLAPLVHGSYAASLIESASIRVPHPISPSVTRYIRMARPAMKIFVRNLPANRQPPNFAIQQNLSNGLGEFEPQALAERPERTHQLLFQAYSEGTAHAFWQEDLWKSLPLPRDHNHATIRRRIRYNSLIETKGAAFLTAHPSTATTVHSTHWSVMIRRHLDLPVHEFRIVRGEKDSVS